MPVLVFLKLHGAFLIFHQIASKWLNLFDLYICLDPNDHSKFFENLTQIWREHFHSSFTFLEIIIFGDSNVNKYKWLLSHSKSAGELAHISLSTITSREFSTDIHDRLADEPNVLGNVLFPVFLLKLLNSFTYFTQTIQVLQFFSNNIPSLGKETVLKLWW